MSNLTWNDVRRLKAAGRFFHAGALAAGLGFDGVYWHLAKRVTFTGAATEYAAGYEAAARDIWEAGFDDSNVVDAVS